MEGTQIHKRAHNTRTNTHTHTYTHTRWDRREEKDQESHMKKGQIVLQRDSNIDDKTR